MAHLLARQDGIGWNGDLGIRDHPLARHVAELGGVACGEHQRDPRHRCGLGNVGDAKARMRMGRAQHHRLQRAGGGMVGDVAAGAAEESVVLFARERSAKTEFGRWHGASIPQARAARPARAGGGASFPRSSGRPRRRSA
jgi:hypothetical protein